MFEFNVKLKSIEDIWSEQKELLKRDLPDIEIDWGGEVPTNEDLYSIYAAVTDFQRNPRDPITLTSSKLTNILEPLLSDLENQWDYKFDGTPDIEILSKDGYLPRINQAEEEFSKMVGFGNSFKSPPTMYHLPSHGKIFVPENFVVRIPKSNLDFNASNLFSDEYDISELPWDRPFLEEVLSEEISHMIFRRLRGEWKDGYVQSVKSMRTAERETVRTLNEAIAHYVRDKLCRGTRPYWGLYQAKEGLDLWSDLLENNYYRSVDALSKIKSVKSIAMADRLIPMSKENKVAVVFYDSHPYNLLKQKSFLV